MNGDFNFAQIQPKIPLRTRIGLVFVKYRTRSSRGGVFTSELDGAINAFQRGGVILLIINQYFEIKTPLWIVPLVWLGQKLFEYGMGWLDEKHLGWWKAENQYVTVNTNPFLVNMDEKLDKLIKEKK